jgi:hypothetical protein
LGQPIPFVKKYEGWKNRTDKTTKIIEQENFISELILSLVKRLLGLYIPTITAANEIVTVATAGDDLTPSCR